MQVLVVFAHPRTDSFNRAVADRATKGLRDAGHTVHFLDLYALGFAGAMSFEERTAYHSDDPILDPLVREHAALAQVCEMFVFVYPTWWSGLPAILKGWLERVMVPGVGFRFNSKGKVRPGLSHVRRLVGISTYGSPWRYVKPVNDNGRRTIMRTIRINTGWWTRRTWLGLYALDTTTPEERADFLDRVEERMRSL